MQNEQSKQNLSSIRALVPVREAYTFLTGKVVNNKVAINSFRKLKIPLVKIGRTSFIRSSQLKSFLENEQKA